MNTIRMLNTYEQVKYGDHLLRLNADDRYLRFGSMVDDAFIIKHATIKHDSGRMVLAAFDEDQNVIAACEICLLGKYYLFNVDEAEIGLSVEKEHRGRRLGTMLFEHAMVVCRNRRVKVLKSYCLTRNGFMMKIAKAHNMQIVNEYGDSEATLELEKADVLSYFVELVGESMALADEYTSIIRKTWF
jgi:GNAT superfamily N-acetyltransferase